MPSEKEIKALRDARDALHRACLKIGSTEGFRADFDAINAVLSAAEKERDAHTNTRDVDDSFREEGQKHETRCLERRGPSTRFLCTCGVSDGEVLFAQLRRWEMRQREMWESAFASGAQGSKVGTALGVLDALAHFLNDLQEQSTPEEER